MFLAPAVLIDTMVMIVPLAETLRLSFVTNDGTGRQVLVHLQNFALLFFDARWSVQCWNALWNSLDLFIIPTLVQNPIGIALAAVLSMAHRPGRTFYRTVIFVPAMLPVVIIGIAWKVILSPLRGVAPSLLDAVGLKFLFKPWLGRAEYALTTLSLISVWQYVGIPMMLIYAAMPNIPEAVIQPAALDDVRGWSLFWKVKLPPITPTIGAVSILTFIGHQLVLGDPNMGAAIATAMFLIILVGVMAYLLGLQRHVQTCRRPRRSRWSAT